MEEGGRAATVPGKSTGEMRTHYRARSASSLQRLEPLCELGLVCFQHPRRADGRKKEKNKKKQKQGSESKWSYQIVFPLDGSRLTAAASLLVLSPEQEESIATKKKNNKGEKKKEACFSL